MNRKVVIIAGMFIGGSLGYQLLYAKLSGSTKNPALMEQGRSTDTQCRLGYALIEAAKGNKLADVQTLINEGANANFAHALTGNTALHHAAQNGNYKMVYALIEEGKANPTIKNQDGQTVKDVARENNHEDIINLIDSIYDERIESFARVSA